MAARRKIPYTGVQSREDAITQPVQYSPFHARRVTPVTAPAFFLPRASRHARDRRLVPW
jgi:hypothetical protein